MLSGNLDQIRNGRRKGRIKPEVTFFRDHENLLQLKRLPQRNERSNQAVSLDSSIDELSRRLHNQRRLTHESKQRTGITNYSLVARSQFDGRLNGIYAFRSLALKEISSTDRKPSERWRDRLPFQQQPCLTFMALYGQRVVLAVSDKYKEIVQALHCRICGLIHQSIPNLKIYFTADTIRIANASIFARQPDWTVVQHTQKVE